MAITLEHLTKRYEGHAVVYDVSLEIGEGELFVLLGPSGSGKSTVLRMIAGLTASDGGRVLLHGRDVSGVSPQQRGVGFVFQHYALFQHMTVAENIEFGLRIQRVAPAERRRRREELLELVGLAGLGNRLPRQLSGGQQQRVALARALAPRPDVLLLDEPFGALDARIRVEMRRSLRQIQHELGITAIFVTHDQEEAFELCDRLGIMSTGRLLEYGPPVDLYLRPRTEFAATFLGSANLLLGTASASGIELGTARFPLHTQAEPPETPRRVQVLFRPEDVALAASVDALSGTALGAGTVERIAFTGAYERLLLRLPALASVRPIAPPVPFGHDSLYVEATRSQDQSRRFPLQTGDAAWVGVLRIHALAHPGLRFLLVATEGSGSQPGLDFGGPLARLSSARVTVLGVGLDAPELRLLLDAYRQQLNLPVAPQSRVTGDPLAEAVVREVEREIYDLVILPAVGRDLLPLIERVLETGEQHLLLVPATPSAARERVDLPKKALICVAGGEASKTDVHFAGRLLRHLGTDSVLLSVVEADGEASAEEPERGRAERFMEAGVRTLAALGVTARTVVRVGPLREAIQAEMAQGDYGLLVLGAPALPMAAARIRPLVTGPLPCPVLLVRSPYAAAGMVRAAASEDALVEEVIA
ncbi:MAG TPA: ATP-binding cassette domain-containing protein [Ktedonobacterales bacterium]|nr:ATP-binding cassette domain-containing protein [Ktedonobacterales bacterium]